MQAMRHLKFFLLQIGCNLILALLSPVKAQFNTAIQDGIISPSEYGIHVNGQNQITQGGTTYYMTWDANNLYFAFSGTNYNEAAVIYLDIDPQIPVNGGGTNANGSTQGLYYYDRNQTMLPFRGDFVVYFKNGYSEYRFDDGAGYWGPNFAFLLSTGTNNATNTIEIAIPWNTITSGAGMPNSFNWLAEKLYDYGPTTNGIYDAIPQGNPICACNQDPSRTYATRYFNILNTSNGSATKPFSLQSLTYHQDASAPGTGGFYLNGGYFYDFTINDNSPNNLDNDPINHFDNNGEISNRVLIEGNIDIAHDLYIAQGSALLPADNVSGNVLATLRMSGANGNIYNFGRIDPNPEVSNFGDWNNRRIDFVFAGNTRLQATNVFKDRWRISNAIILPGASLLGPSLDSLEVELQFGVLNNQGIIDLGDGLSGFADLGLRGDWSQHNDYFFEGAGIWKIHDILVGRNSSKLQAANSGTTVYLQVQGDFSNYDEFLGKNGTGQIDVVMAGKKRQYFRGNTTETNSATTTFYNLGIANNNGLSDNNNTADVWFESAGGGTIDYFLEGTLVMFDGDLVTRDRNTSIVHNFTLRDSAQVLTPGAKSNIGLNASCFIDGPMRYEIENAGLVTRQFPIGKTKTVSSYALGDYRHVQLEIDHDASAKTTYQAETWLDDRSTSYTWPSPIPETISWISTQRYWNLSKLPGGANVDAAFVSLAYDLIERNDGVINAPALRIVKDDGSGNWVNLTPLGPGGTANFTGQIRSFPFTSFSDFTLASTNPLQLLGVEMQEFDAFRRDEHVELRWQGIETIDFDHYEIERSSDQVNFETIGQLASQGRPNLISNYRFTDFNPLVEAEISFYRLKFINRVGESSYSPIRAVNFEHEANENFDIFPNPSTGMINIVWHGALNLDSNPEISIFSTYGKEIVKRIWAEEAAYLQLDLSKYPKGIYLLKIKSSKGSFVNKLILE